MDRGGQGQTLYSEGSKRKMEEVDIEFAKQRAQEIAARLVNSAELKRPRLDPSAPAAEVPPFTPSAQTSYPVFTPTIGQYNGLQGSTKKIHIPNAKVGVIIGRGGDMIQNLQLRSGAKIQITRDPDVQPGSLTRDVDLSGTKEQVSRAEELINEVIAATDAAATGSSANRGVTAPPGGEQFVMKVPNDKVALIIGKGGDTIKNMQSRTGARMQVVPLHLPPGDPSTERSLYISGTTEQIEAAKALANDIISGVGLSSNRLKGYSTPTAYTQPSYPPNGGWPPQAYHQQSGYGYDQQASYSTPTPYYGRYLLPTASWDPTNPSGVPLPPPPPQNPSYNLYGLPQTQQPAMVPPPPPTGLNYIYGQAPASTTTTTTPTFNYNQWGYSSQPQDSTPPAPPTYGPPLGTSSQSDGTAPASVPTSQPGYGAPGVSPQPDTSNSAQSQPGYGAGNGQPADGCGAYTTYETQPVPSSYSQADYSQMGYAQQHGGEAATSPQPSYSYYGQSDMTQSHTPTPPGQDGYYQGGYLVQPGQPQPAAKEVSKPPPSCGTETASDGNTAAAEWTAAVANETNSDSKK